MSQPGPIAVTAAAPARAEVHAAIQRAAAATGVDFAYLLAQAKLESNLDPTARAATSSAAGLYQFTQGTWRATLAKHGATYGLPGGDEAGVLALRSDPQAASLMAAELARDNRAALLPVLGREPDPAELYLAHFLGAAGAGKFLAALQTDPAQSAAALLPAAAGANRPIFYDRSGAARSVGEVMTLLRGKVEGAMGAELPVANATLAAAGAALPPLAREFHALAGQQPQRLSMAEVLRSTFGADAPAVRTAHDRLARFGL